MHFKTISDLNQTIIEGLSRIPKDTDLIVGIPRSGILVASIIGLYKNLPITDLNSFLEGKIYECGTTKARDDWIKDIDQAKSILIVDDSVCSGNALNTAKRKIEARYPEKKILYAAVYVVPNNAHTVDIAFEKCHVPRVFEWNYLHHSQLSHACFDLDGVLCDDPTPEQNDDGQRYLDFISNASLRVMPTRPIAYIVTSRLEKYRAETELWLKKNGIQYENLIMMQYSSAAERQQAGDHGRYKGEFYKKQRTAMIFVESDPVQAAEIAAISRKLVYCVGDQKVYNEKGITKIKSSAAVSYQKLKNLIKRLLPANVIDLIKRVKAR